MIGVETDIQGARINDDSSLAVANVPLVGTAALGTGLATAPVTAGSSFWGSPTADVYSVSAGRYVETINITAVSSDVGKTLNITGPGAGTAGTPVVLTLGANTITLAPGQTLATPPLLGTATYVESPLKWGATGTVSGVTGAHSWGPAASAIPTGSTATVTITASAADVANGATVQISGTGAPTTQTLVAGVNTIKLAAGQYITPSGLITPTDTVKTALVTPLASGSAHATINWFGTTRARAGVLLGSNVLFYGTAGVAYGGVSSTGTSSLDNFSDSATKWGYVLGAGAEWKIDHHWSVKGEYLFVDLGANNLLGNATAINTSGAGGNGKADNQINAVRLGLNYKF